MTYNTFIYIILIPILGLLLLIVNILFSTKDTYNAKTDPFECGLSSWQQTRAAYHVSFTLIAILFLPFDLEVSSILPYAINLYTTNGYGLSIIIIFTIILSIGFIYEYQKGALNIPKNHIKPLNNNKTFYN